MARQIPDGSVEIQTGLWAYLRTYTVNGTPRSRYELYSADGYCFYCISENLDEDGNLKPENERLYAQYASLGIYTNTIEVINADYVSVPVEAGYEIVSVPSTPNEVM